MSRKISIEKGMSKKSRIDKVKYMIKELTKKGLNIDKVTEGKTVEKLASSYKSILNMNKRYEREKQRPSLEKELEGYRKNRKEELRTELKKISKEQIKKSKLTSKTKAIIKKPEFNKEFPQYMDFDNVKTVKELNNIKSKLKKMSSLDKQVEVFTKVKANEFFRKYFKELSLSPDEVKRVENLINVFGSRLDMLNDVIDTVLKRIEILDMSDTNEVTRIHGEDGKYDEMKKRLDMFEIYLKNKYSIDIIDYKKNKHLKG